MTVSDTHADTTGASLDELFQPRWQTYRDLAASIPETDPPHPAAGVASMLTCASHDVEQLRDEVERERARADRAEAALADALAEIGVFHEAVRNMTTREIAEGERTTINPTGIWPHVGRLIKARAALSAGSGGRETTP